MTDLPKVGETVYMLTKPTKIEVKIVTGIDQPNGWGDRYRHVKVRGPNDKWDSTVYLSDLSYDPLELAREVQEDLKKKLAKAERSIIRRKKALMRIEAYLPANERTI